MEHKMRGGRGHVDCRSFRTLGTMDGGRWDGPLLLGVLSFQGMETGDLVMWFRKGSPRVVGIVLPTRGFTGDHSTHRI